MSQIFAEPRPRWYVAYPISYHQIEEMMGERGVEVDHSTLNRWILKYVPALEKAFLAHKRPADRSWRLDMPSRQPDGLRWVEAVWKRGAVVSF
jgi:putative transposase